MRKLSIEKPQLNKKSSSFFETHLKSIVFNMPSKMKAFEHFFQNIFTRIHYIPANKNEM